MEICKIYDRSDLEYNIFIPENDGFVTLITRDVNFVPLSLVTITQEEINSTILWIVRTNIWTPKFCHYKVQGNLALNILY